MLKRLIPVLCLSLLAGPSWSQSEQAVEAPEAVPEQIVVVGQRPGPGLWKVSKGDHVLWVFGLYAPLHKKMEWRSQQVEAILAQSQEYIYPPAAQAEVGFFKSLTLLPHAIGYKKLPDGGKLKDVLPADVHARWLPIKQKYFGDDDGIERERPIFVADELFHKGLYLAGMASDKQVRDALDKVVKKHKIKTTSPAIQLAVEEPAKLLKDFKKSPLDDADCFARTLEQLETDIDAMRVRANAWAKGDLEVIRKLNYAERDEACWAAIQRTAFIRQQPGDRSVPERMRDAWLAAAEKALAANASTFAVLKIQDLLNPKGYLAALEAKGYVVERPE